MPNLIKKSWTASMRHPLLYILYEYQNLHRFPAFTFQLSQSIFPKKNKLNEGAEFFVSFFEMHYCTVYKYIGEVSYQLLFCSATLV